VKNTTISLATRLSPRRVSRRRINPFAVSPADVLAAH
jgi:hypothetical protein